VLPLTGGCDRCDDAAVVGSPRDVPLVGRERELGALRSAVTDAAEGRARAVLVAGEAGGGKSRLVRALLTDHVVAGARVLRTQCVDLGGAGLPSLAIADLLREASSDADPTVEALLDRVPVLAGLTGPAALATAPDESRRLQLFDAMSAVLAELGRIGGPVVVVVEDLQWIDASSADFLRFLLSRMSAERLVVVATVRTDGLAMRPAARRLVGDLGRLPALARLDLEPFGIDEVAAYLDHVDGVPAGADVAAAVLRRTRGTPFYVETLAADLARTGRVDDGVPRGLADVLVGRVDALPETARAVARCAAVVAGTVPDRLLRAVSEVGDHALDEALRVAVGEGVLVSEGAGYAFAHDLLRAAVHDDLLPGERARLHHACAAALEAGADGRPRAAAVAHHFTEAGDAPKALVWSVRAAAEAMEVLAPAEALLHLERALATWPDVAAAADLAGVTEATVAVRAARAAGWAGEHGRAVAWARRGADLCDAGGDVTGGVEARAEQVRSLLAGDTPEETIRHAEDAVRIAETHDVDAGTRALAHVLLARALVSARRLIEARPQAERALAAARTAGTRGLEVEALAALAFVEEIEGDRPAAADRLAAALRLARSAGEPAAELRAYFALASLHYYGGDVGGALPVLDAAVARVAECGLRWSHAVLELRLLHRIARYVAADLEEAPDEGEPADRPPDAAAARLAAVGCYAAVAAGHPDAERRLAALHDSWDADPQVALVAGGCEADLLTWRGDPAAAVDVAGRAQRHLDAVVGEGMYGGLWLSALGLAALADHAAACRRRRDQEAVDAALRQGEELRLRVERLVTGGHGRPGDLGPEGRAWHARAVAEHARLHDRPAVPEWEAAVAAFGYGHAYEEARCRWRLAAALVMAGDRSAAAAEAATAGAAAARMKAVPLQRAIAATVSQARLAGATSAADAVLTGREREVLALVAEGLTNREVGRRLFISEKTASVHLSNLMAKLNVSSRTEAVTVAQRRGLLELPS
jgi:DNA-binding CsgD family transcriptional regulator/tetratricopeptide (TPR) repeat protein